MKDINWAGELGVAITVSDTTGKILYMNDKSASTFARYGGHGLEGSNLQECHKEESWGKILDIMNSKKSNCYTNGCPPPATCVDKISIRADNLIFINIYL